jgi:hypothetical protein
MKLRRTLAVFSAPLMLAALPVLAATPPDEAAIRTLIQQGKAAESEAAAPPRFSTALSARCRGRRP